MRSLMLLVFVCMFCYVLSKNVKTLSEPMDQEVIEIAGPKELPAGIEEEPSGDLDDEDDLKASTDSVTKRDSRKTTTVADGRRRLKDVEKIDGTTAEDEEARLEKELAEIYKDTDYKDSAEDTSEPKETSTTTETTGNTSLDDNEKPIGRQRNNFKFAPDTTNKQDVERFRTSIDDINCKERGKLSAVHPTLVTRPSKDGGADSGSQTISTGTVAQISLALLTIMWI